MQKFNIKEGFTQVISYIRAERLQYCWIIKLEFSHHRIFNIFMENFVWEALHNHHTFVSICGRVMCTRHWSDSRHQQRTERPYQQTKMETSTDKGEVPAIGNGKEDFHKQGMTLRGKQLQVLIWNHPLQKRQLHIIITTVTTAMISPSIFSPRSTVFC